MGCYKNIIDSLRLCGNGDDPVDECGQVDCVCHYGERDSMCRQKVMFDAADAIEELLAAEPPSLWTDEPIEGTEFMTHSQGGRKGFEIHFRTDSLEKYKAVQEECRRQIGHAKPEPPKEVE